MNRGFDTNSGGAAARVHSATCDSTWNDALQS